MRPSFPWLGQGRAFSLSGPEFHTTRPIVSSIIQWNPWLQPDWQGKPLTPLWAVCLPFSPAPVSYLLCSPKDSSKTSTQGQAVIPRGKKKLRNGNSLPFLTNYDIPTLYICFSSVLCPPWALNTISGAGWLYQLCCNSPPFSCFLSQRILHLRIQASSDVFHMKNSRWGWGSRWQPWPYPGYLWWYAVGAAAEKGPTWDLVLCSTVWNPNGFCFGFVFFVSEGDGTQGHVLGTLAHMRSCLF